MSTLFITATGTDIGKTFIACALAHQLKNADRDFAIRKPVASGGHGDTLQLLHASSLACSEENIRRVTPWRYAAPLSPHRAARLEMPAPSLDEIVAACAANAETVLVEGAGGIMSPLNEMALNIDLAERLNAHAVLVAGSYLGSISHTLTALEVIKARGLNADVIINGDAPEDVAEDIRQFTHGAYAVYAVPRFTGADAWKNAPNLLPICCLPATGL